MIPKEILDSLPFQIRSSHQLSGGSINYVFRLNTNEGEFCLKYNHSKTFPGMFEAEARGLALLSSAGEICVPEVIRQKSLEAHTYLLLEYIRSGSPVASFMADFGRSMAGLHRHSAEKYGLPFDNYMGSLAQSNNLHGNWIDFFVSERLQKQVRLARENGKLTENNTKQFDLLYGHLGHLLPAEKPSLLHGDLWSGNFITSQTGLACLIDPAVYYGHRETDIAMTSLFGGFGMEFYSGYNEAWPLETGWKSRLDLYNLYPLLVHLNLFGSGYLGSILTILNRFV